MNKTILAALGAPEGEALFQAIKHGDAGHQAWLQAAISAHFAGEEIPAPRAGSHTDNADR